MKKLLFYAELAIHHPAKSEKAQTIRIPASTLGGLQGGEKNYPFCPDNS